MIVAPHVRRGVSVAGIVVARREVSLRSCPAAPAATTGGFSDGHSRHAPPGMVRSSGSRGAKSPRRIASPDFRSQFQSARDDSAAHRHPSPHAGSQRDDAPLLSVSSRGNRLGDGWPSGSSAGCFASAPPFQTPLFPRPAAHGFPASTSQAASFCSARHGPATPRPRAASVSRTLCSGCLMTSTAKARR